MKKKPGITGNLTLIQNAGKTASQAASVESAIVSLGPFVRTEKLDCRGGGGGL